MLQKLSRSFAFAVLACALANPAAHAQQTKAEYPVVEKLWHGDYDVDRDGRVTETVTTRVQVLQENLLERFKLFSVSYSASIQTGEVLEAYTVKADGREVRVPPGNFQLQTAEGRRGAGPMFSDRSTIQVVFPDLAVGDAVHIRYRVVDKEPMFPGQFSLALSFSPYAASEDTRVTLHLPKELPRKTEAHFMQPQPAREEAGKSVLEWRLRNPQPPHASEEDGGLWKQEELPSVLVSTFDSYEAIGRAYAERALPKAQATPRIQALARETIGPEKQPREQARLLYEWVSRNITYGGNCIGVGAVVPRDVDVVLDNRMGDCKDHATLLQAMLAAAGIRSEQVLINAGSQFDLPATPVVSQVNHVMNFLPDFGLYVDATAKEIPFGYLPVLSYSKPVIHVGAATRVASIPAEPANENQQRLRMQLKVAENGAATGSMHVELQGVPAAYMRAMHRALSADEEREFVKRALATYGYRGKGTLDKGSMAGLSDRYAYDMKFEIDNFLQAGANGAFVFYPVMGSPLPVTLFSNVDARPTLKRRDPCQGFVSGESYSIELPATLSLLAMPEDLRLRGSILDFDPRYTRKGNTVLVEREVNDKTSQGICSPAIQAEFLKQARPLGEHLRTQVLYRRKAS